MGAGRQPREGDEAVLERPRLQGVGLGKMEEVSIFHMSPDSGLNTHAFD